MTGIIGKKIGMTNHFDENGKSHACTVIEAGPCVVTQIKTMEKDGYESVQLGFDEKKEKRTTAPLLGHFKKSGVAPQRKLVEFRGFKFPDSEVTLGLKVSVDQVFKAGDFVDVIGKSKGKGFQGVVKRHGFAGVGQATHGQHNRLRAPGSVGGSSYPSRVFPGLRMAGRTGGDRVKLLNLKILKLFPEKNILVVSGAVPGAKNGYLLIEK